MQMFDDSGAAWEEADPAHFSGQARIKRSGVWEGADTVRQYRVEFQAGARTHWHTHSGPQLLVVVSGVCVLQRWGEAPVRIGAGQTVLVEPDEKHWHGADLQGPMVHLAVNVNAATTWLEEAAV